MEGRKEIVKILNLKKKFGKIIAIKDLTFNIYPGISGLIGPNGSGKTTTINILAGLVYPDYGEAYIYGLNPLKDKEELIGKVAFLLEDANLPNSITVEDYMIYISNKILKNTKRDWREVLDELGLYDLRKRKIRTLSAGMKQKLLIAQCILPNPEMIILDEPTANLDPISRMNLLSNIQNMWREHSISFLISTHLLPILEQVINYVIFIKDGMKITEGKYNELIEKFYEGYNLIEVEASKAHDIIEILKKFSNVEIVNHSEKIVIFKVYDNTKGFTKEFLKEIIENNIDLRKYTISKPSLDELFKKYIQSPK